MKGKLEKFENGTLDSAYEIFGSFITKNSVIFRVWAPNAKAVSVVGDFNGWNKDCNYMENIGYGVWETKIGNLGKYSAYKYAIKDKNGNVVLKSDPYARHFETPPANASKVYEDNYKWQDEKWINSKGEKSIYESPVNIYELHAGSWKRYEDGNTFDYVKLANELAEYVKDMNYTHVELMPITEYPFEGSWGYQVTGYYAPTSRYGKPEDFMYLVNQLHKNKIGVILDWVPAHFPRDGFGLANFDGTCLYEHPDPRRGEHPDWGTKIFNYARKEVSNFLIANAMFWVEKFHVDGLRVDAVASMLYLDYGKQDGEWLANEYGNNKNLDAIEFFRHLNSIMQKRNPGTLMIAEESTAWPMVTGDAKEGGLGFSFKWNMGWMHDFCEYMKLDPLFRKDNHYKMTFAMSYNGSENYILPLSHDEVVHLKCSMLNKMPGFYVDKFANLRVGYTYMFTHSGKKLLFMGQDFGQDHEWDESKELDWDLLSDHEHSSLKYYVSKLLELYRKYPALSEIDRDWAGFEWMNADDCEQSTYSYVRKASSGKNSILVVLNMTPIERKDFKVGVPKKKKYTLLLNSDEECFGGRGNKIPASITAKAEEADGKPYSLTFDLPAYGAAVFRF